MLVHKSHTRWVALKIFSNQTLRRFVGGFNIYIYLHLHLHPHWPLISSSGWATRWSRPGSRTRWRSWTWTRGRAATVTWAGWGAWAGPGTARAAPRSSTTGRSSTARATRRCRVGGGRFRSDTSYTLYLHLQEWAEASTRRRSTALSMLSTRWTIGKCFVISIL